MTILEAIRSGKKFRKCGWRDWHDFEDGKLFVASGTREYWLQDDWEIEEPKLSLSARMIREAAQKCRSIDDMCMILGFEE